MKYNPAQQVKTIADTISLDYSLLDAEDIEYIALETQLNYECVCKILNITLPVALT